MRIEGSAYVVDLSRSQALAKESGQTGAVQGAAPASRLRSPDRVEISSQARELEKLKQDMSSLPEVRLDRVALAKQTLQYGDYRVDPSLLAQRMMESYETA